MQLCSLKGVTCATEHDSDMLWHVLIHDRFGHKMLLAESISKSTGIPLKALTLPKLAPNTTLLHLC